MLVLDSVNAAYGSIQVLYDISLRVEVGEAVAILGPNGAGKTTLLKTIAGHIKSTSGLTSLNGKNISNLKPELAVKEGIGQVLEGRQLFGPLSVLENLKLGAYARFKFDTYKNILRDIEKVYELFPRLEERRSQKSNTLSGGEQMMLAIGRAIMSKPKILLLDEPSMGLAPMVVSDIFKSLKSLRDEGITLVIVEQNPDAAFLLAERCYVLEVGRIVHSGPSSNLQSSKELAQFYLGLD
jgi:branched-chain amino acid transport system ATP-binding protein